MDTTENLSLPYIMPAQAHKHLTHNEAIRALDALLHLAVATRSLATPPASPAAGERYIVPAGAGAEWSGKAKAVAAWQGGGWSFHAPREGWLASVLDENRILVFKAGNWTPAAFDLAIPNQVGINTTANTTNRLAGLGFCRVGQLRGCRSHVYMRHGERVASDEVSDLCSQAQRELMENW